MESVSTMGSGSIGRELDLDVLINAIQSAVDPDITPTRSGSGMVSFRLESEGPAFQFYRSGAFQIRGAPTREALMKSEERLLELLDKIGVEVREYRFEQRTAVFIENLERRIDLERLMLELGMENAEYEPEQFPALIYKPSSDEVTLLIFSSGKVIVNGTVNEGTAEKAIEHLRIQLD